MSHGPSRRRRGMQRALCACAATAFLFGCAVGPVTVEVRRVASGHPQRAAEPSIGSAAITDAWQARVFGHRNTWRRTRRACRRAEAAGNQAVCAAIGDRLERGRRKELRRAE